MKYYIFINCHKFMLKKNQDNLNITVYREAINSYHKFQKMNSEVTYKWWLKTRKFETYMILWNYS
jgi:hypothetical protein